MPSFVCEARLEAVIAAMFPRRSHFALFVSILFALATRQSEAWVVGLDRLAASRRTTHHHRTTTTTTALTMVESISVAIIGSDNHDQIGQELADSVQRWLDSEWMPQEVHRRLGEACKQSYVACREAGQDDLMMIMTTTADNLSDKWDDEYNKDAFVGAWDVTNYVSDFLTAKAGIEGCQCSATIH